jgi:UDP-N-acetylglucosamine 2-epimerase (non-hydrolysing)
MITTKVLSVIGTRPEAIKMAPVIQALRARPDKVESYVCMTGQHREIANQAKELFGIAADFDLNVMRPGQSLIGTAAAILARFESVLHDLRPDWVLVQGDTTTVAMTAIAAHYMGSKVGHVEAGLRTFDKTQPFPEESNRRVTAVVADKHFAPTDIAVKNLLKENIAPAIVYHTGNTIIDAVRMVREYPFSFAGGQLEWIERLSPEVHLVLITAHRRENFGEGIRNICGAIKDIAVKQNGTVQFIYPVHPNPNIYDVVYKSLDGVDHVHLTPPLDYLTLFNVLLRADIVLTDSGGIQEEACALGKRVIILRDVTERPEVVHSGMGVLAGSDPARIINQFTAASGLGKPGEVCVNPYGDGYAAERIVAAILDEPIIPLKEM